ncbi:MAG: cytochrome C [Sulfurimonas sp.]|uniref:cytochrome C n=1 Tax=Sulfurimonas sp. TaxID=2022749 RepID=UPI002616EC8B|nr:cytochrome C [Sulfurimonas sp.]MCW8894680.1 cytochrome C [Sulfurimonas sp.]MCW8953605.1 cytochrome C [Sulfurimonas sp.]
MRALLFHGNCTTCHFENKTVSAPSVLEFKNRYMQAFKDKEDFVSYMSTWVKHPKEETSLMHDAVKKHGLMPELGYDINTLKEISAYIYETDFTKHHEGHKD